jgi:hypothetical protein
VTRRVTRRHDRILVCAVAVALVGLSVTGCRKMAERVAEKGVEAVKNTSKGLEEGAEKGRKQGASTDDALVVASLADLKGAGSLTVDEVRRAPVGTEVVIVVDNTSDRPLRLTRLDVFALDSKGFVKRPVSAPPEITVPAKAKDKLVVAFETAQGKQEKLAKARIWGAEYDLPAPTK